MWSLPLFGYIDTASFLIMLSICDKKIEEPFYDQITNETIDWGVKKDRLLKIGFPSQNNLLTTILLSTCKNPNEVAEVFSDSGDSIVSIEGKYVQYFGHYSFNDEKPVISVIDKKLKNLESLIN